MRSTNQIFLTTAKAIVIIACLAFCGFIYFSFSHKGREPEEDQMLAEMYQFYLDSRKDLDTTGAASWAIGLYEAWPENEKSKQAIAWLDTINLDIAKFKWELQGKEPVYEQMYDSLNNLPFEIVDTGYILSKLEDGKTYAGDVTLWFDARTGSKARSTISAGEPIYLYTKRPKDVGYYYVMSTTDSSKQGYVKINWVTGLRH